MLKIISSSHLRSNLKDAIDLIKETKKPLFITDRNIPTAVLVDIDEYEDYLSLKDKAYLKSIKQAKKEYLTKDVFSMSDVFGGTL